MPPIYFVADKAKWLPGKRARRQLHVGGYGGGCWLQWSRKNLAAPVYLLKKYILYFFLLQVLKCYLTLDMTCFLVLRQTIFVFFPSIEIYLRQKITTTNKSYTYTWSIIPFLVYSQSFLVLIVKIISKPIVIPDEVSDVVTKLYTVQVATMDSRLKTA